MVQHTAAVIVFVLAFAVASSPSGVSLLSPDDDRIWADVVTWLNDAPQTTEVASVLRSLREVPGQRRRRAVVGGPDDQQAPRDDARALDVGLGQDRNAVSLACPGWNVTGIDLSEEGLASARAQRRGAA